MARRIRFSQMRDDKSFRRRAGQKPPRSITLIVCEGETEQAYFAAARDRYGLSTTEVIVASNDVGAAPISVVKCAEDKCEERGGYDKVFCVFDRDVHSTFDKARERIRALSSRKRSLPIAEAISIPCFELWVLLHFERTDSPFQNSLSVIERVVSHMPDYAKASPSIAKRLMTKVDDAIDNADWLEKRAVNNDYNPYTSVHHVLRHFAEVAKQKDAV